MTRGPASDDALDDPAGDDGVSSAATAAGELVEVVDENGDVTGIVTRAEMRAGGLRHRCTYVVVLTSDDRVVVHQRAAWKDVAASAWDLAFGGVCDVGERWDDAAARELAEEAGITGVDLQPLAPVSLEAGDARIVGRAYWCRSDAEPTCPDGEVQAVDTVALADLESWLEGRDVPIDTELVVVPLVLGLRDRR